MCELAMWWWSGFTTQREDSAAGGLSDTCLVFGHSSCLNVEEPRNSGVDTPHTRKRGQHIMTNARKHLLKKVALVAITITTAAATSGVVDAAGTRITPTTTKVSSSPYSGDGSAPATTSGIRW